jgi:hypothetical protein
MVGATRDMVTYSQAMIMSHCETCTMSRDTFSRSMETMSMSREK